MNRWFDIPAEKPGWVLLAVLSFTLFAAAGLIDLRTGALRLGIDPSPQGLLPSKGPEREIYDRVMRQVGSAEPLLLVIGAEDVFQPAVLEHVKALTARLAEVESVRKVVSLFTANDIWSSDGEIFIAPFLEQVPEDAKGLARVRGRVSANPLAAGSLVSEDARAIALLVYMDPMSDREYIEGGFDDEIARLAREEVGDLDLWISGSPHLKYVLATSMLQELSYILPAIVGLLAVVLFLCLRSLRGVVLPILAILVALLWTLGTLAWLGQDLNLVTISVPTLVLTIGFAYAMHVVTEYEAEASSAPEEDRTPGALVRRTMHGVAVPVIVTAATTAAGFVSLAIYSVVAIRQFGLFSLLAVLFTLIASLTLVPALLALLPVPGRDGKLQSRWLTQMAERLARFSTEHSRAVIAAAVAVMVLSAAGVPRIRVAAEFIGVIDPKSQVRLDYEAINERMGGAREIRILLESDAPQAFLVPENLLTVRDLQDWLEAQPEIGTTTSLADYVMLLHRAIKGDDPAYFSIPETSRSVSQLLLFGASRDTQSFVGAGYQTANVMLRSQVADSDDVADLVARITNRLEQLPGHLNASVTGIDVLLGAVIDDVSRGQLESIIVAFLLIYLMLALLFTSFRVALIALFPNVLPIVFYFGILGFTGITLNPSTSLVGCLALGIAVDDTIHFFARFNHEARRVMDERRGAQLSLIALIRPVTFTTVGLCLGFLVLLISENRGLAEFGLVAAIALAMAWLADVTLNPALCSGLRIVTLWDLVRVDLGEDPQREIPLFEDLSHRQSRIFTLMSDLREVGPGERVFTEDEPADDMFVVLEGTLKAWLQRDGKQIPLRTMGRGAVVGEGGYFTTKRGANVDVAEDSGATLIRFDSEDLDRLRRYYPRAGALVYRNLNRILAQRMADTTRLVH